MKRIIGIVICVISLLLTHTAFAMTNILSAPKSGEEISSASTVKEGNYYSIVGDFHKATGGWYSGLGRYFAWYQFTASETGEYVFYGKPVNSEGSAFSIDVYDQNDNQIAGDNFRICDEISYSVELNANTTYYFSCMVANDYNRIDDKELKADFAICSPSNHTALSDFQEVVAPTCTDDGYSARICETCGREVERKTLPATGHTPGSPIVVNEPSCIQKGQQIIKCSVCDELLETQEIPMVDHTPGQMLTVSSATCTENGLNEQRCTVCNTLLSSETLPALGHKGGQWVVDREATCTENGQRSQYCVNCGALLADESIPALGHDTGDWEISREASCTQTGSKEKKCNLCGQVLESETLPALGHEYSEWEIVRESTKNEEGERQRHCVRCGETESEAIEKKPKFLGIF